MLHYINGKKINKDFELSCPHKVPPPFNLPRIAKTMLSFSTSMDPEQTKKMACRASPCRRRYSPGAQKEVLICLDRERRQPRLAAANSDSCRISLLRCMVMSDRSSSGKSFSSCGGECVLGEGGQQCGKHKSCENGFLKLHF